MALRGKFSHCKAPIGARYPLIELFTALRSLEIATHFPLRCLAWRCCFQLCIDCGDLHRLRYPVAARPINATLTVGRYCTGTAWFNPVSHSDAVIGTMAGYLSLWSIYWLFKLLTGKEGMGYGDFKLLAALGAWLGWQQLPVIVLLSSVVGVIFGLIQLRQQKRYRYGLSVWPLSRHRGWFALLSGDKVIDWYFTTWVGQPL